MKCKLLTLFLLIAAGSAAAAPTMSWSRSDTGATYQCWSFDTNPNASNAYYDGDSYASYVLEADHSSNPYGTPLASISGVDKYPNLPFGLKFGWWNETDGRQGVWAAHILNIDLNIPNSQNTQGFCKEIFLTMDFKDYRPIDEIISDGSVMVMTSDGNIVTQWDYMITPNDNTDGWRTFTGYCRIEPNPVYETISLNLIGTGGWLDQVCVDTICRPVAPPTVPAPGAIVLGSFGAVMTGFLRRRRSL